MSMSQCTTFVLLNGKEEVKIKWDLANGELEIVRERLPKIDEEPESKPRIQSFCVRASDFQPQEWMELCESICIGFRKLFLTYRGMEGLDEEDIENMLGCPFDSTDDDEDDDDDE